MWWFIIGLTYSKHKLQTILPSALGQIWGKAGEKIENISWAMLMEVMLLISTLWIKIYVDQIRTKKELYDIWYNIIIVDTKQIYVVWEISQHCSALQDSLHFCKSEMFFYFLYFSKINSFLNKWNVYLKNMNFPIYCLSTHSIVYWLIDYPWQRKFFSQ